MLKFDEQEVLAGYAGALALRPQIEAIVDAVCERGYDSIYFLGIGGTYASALQVVSHIREHSALPAYAENAGSYNTTGNRLIGAGTVLVISSVSGTTSEMVEAVKRAKAEGASVIGFIDTPDTPLYTLADHVVCYPTQEQLKFFMVADRFMKNREEFPEYDRYYAEMDASLPRALVEVEKKADAFGREFAEKHRNDPIHYFVGAGNQYGATYSYAMSYWEEQHWLRTKSIHAAEFFHGMLEIIDRDTPITVFVGEDAERPLAQRVADFLPRVCANYTVIDTKEYALEGISPEFRGSVSHLVLHAVTQRIDAYIEKLNCHPMEIRRYYRQFKY